MIKGIKVSRDHDTRMEQINDYIKELGGKKLRRTRNNWTGNLRVVFNSDRVGECGYTRHKKRGYMDEQCCFGDEKVFQKCHKPYDGISHYTFVKCEPGCWKKAVVVCVRQLSTSLDYYMTAHKAGECPYCYYITDF